ncbi:hypothetical protein RFI_26138, partial [Reticulomyxa filosa]
CALFNLFIFFLGTITLFVYEGYLEPKKTLKTYAIMIKNQNNELKLKKKDNDNERASGLFKKTFVALMANTKTRQSITIKTIDLHTNHIICRDLWPLLLQFQAKRKENRNRKRKKKEKERKKVIGEIKNGLSGGIYFWAVERAILRERIQFSVVRILFLSTQCIKQVKF